MIAEVSHLQEIVESLITNSNDPFTLPKSSEQIIHDMKGQDSTVWAPLNVSLDGRRWCGCRLLSQMGVGGVS